MYLIYLGNKKRHEKWTDAQIKYLKLNYKNYTNKELAETLGRSAYTAQAVNEINCEAIYELAWLKQEVIT